MAKSIYMVAEPKNLSRQNLDGEGKTVTVWVPRESYGTFTSVRAAKVAWMTALEPELVGAAEDFVVMHFDRQMRNLGMAKIVKVSCTQK